MFLYRTNSARTYASLYSLLSSDRAYPRDPSTLQRRGDRDRKLIRAIVRSVIESAIANSIVPLPFQEGGRKLRTRRIGSRNRVARELRASVKSGIYTMLSPCRCFSACFPFATFFFLFSSLPLPVFFFFFFFASPRRFAMQRG